MSDPIEKMVTDTRLALAALTRERNLSAFADSLKGVHNLALATHARNLLAGAFPDHRLAVFARYYNEDSPHLLQLLAGDDQEDVDLSTRAWPGWTTEEQRRAAYLAERAVTYIGGDEEILEHLDPGEIDHDDWTEFQLPLGDG